MTSNTSNTIGATGGEATDGRVVARSSSCPPNVGSSIAVDSTTGEGLSRSQSPERFLCETWVPINNSHQHDNSALAGLDDYVPEYDDFALADPGHDTPEDFVHVGYTVNGHIVDPYESAFYIGAGEPHYHGMPETYMAVGEAGGHSTLPLLDSPLLFNTLETLSGDEYPTIRTVAAVVPKSTPTEMHKFMLFPAEIRLMIWKMAIADSTIHLAIPRYARMHQSIQRFRFGLAYDASRVKPGQDKSRGWVACFTPLKINTEKHLGFLRASPESRAILLRGMDILTVHELPVDQNGQTMAPRKCQMPFNFTKDIFCVEGISHALEQAKKSKENEDAVWDPQTLSLVDLLDNALGLRFAPRIKRMAIIPHYSDVAPIFYSETEQGHTLRVFPLPFMDTQEGYNMAVLAKRFPVLVSIKSAIPLKWEGWERAYNPSSPSRGKLAMTSAGLRGKGQGGPSGMSQEVRDGLYVQAWKRIFDRQFDDCKHRLEVEFFDDFDCNL